MATQLHGIGEYVKRLEKIAEQCGDKVQKDAVQKDEFLRHKKRCYELLVQVREDIAERSSILKKRGNCYETIQKGNNIRQQLTELKETVPKLQQLHKKAEKKWGANKRKEELQERFQAIRLLNRDVKEADELFLSCNAAGTEAASLLGGGDDGLEARMFGNLRLTAAEEDNNREMTGDEQAALEKIRGKDKDIDGRIAELVDPLERLRNMAGEMGQSADRTKKESRSSCRRRG